MIFPFVSRATSGLKRRNQTDAASLHLAQPVQESTI
jgi:hypothetical protein